MSPPAASPRWSLLKASEPERARFATIITATMLLLTHVVFALSLPAETWHYARSLVPHVSFGPPTLGVLLYCLWRKDLPLRLSRALFLALVLCGLPSMMVLDSVMSSQGRAWTPFIGERTVLLGIGLFSPLTAPASLALGLLLVAASWVHWLVELRALQPLATWTPWVTTVWGVLTCLLMLYRRSVDAALNDAASTRAELENLRSAARTLLVMRDGVNTPLQTLTLGLAMLERDPQRVRALLPNLRRAHAQMCALMQHSAEVEDPLRTWEGDELSPDPHQELERLRERLQELERGHLPH